MKNKIVLFFTHPLFLGVVGLLCLFLLVWFIGPLIGIAEHVPLGSSTVRLLVMGGLLLVFALRQSWKFFKVQRKNAQLLEQMSQEDKGALSAAELAKQRQEDERADIRKRFEDAIVGLKKARLGASATRPGWRDYLQMSSGRFVYELPWYMFIGAPGSGKTTALQNAGLRFPLADKLGPDAVRGVGGTRSCDWWFADEAVLIDTAGRYTTQDSDAETDAAAWGAFLKLLRKFRPRQPINGILLTVSVPDLLRTDAEGRERHAGQLRARLNELSEGLGVRAPVYVLVTKTDMLAGFGEFFGALTLEERAQVWGVTLPMEADANAAATAPSRRLAEELQALKQRLESHMFGRLAETGDVRTRGAQFAFPQQVAALLPRLAEFLDRVSESGKLAKTPMLRGVYFTSGTQEGTPIDRVMGALARTFRIAQRGPARPPGSGRSYFLTRLLRDVVFAEQGVGALDPQRERRERIVRGVALGTIGVAAVALAAGLLTSTIYNRAYVAEVQSKVSALSDKLDHTPASPNLDLATATSLLDAVRGIARTPGVDPDAPTLRYRFGLFQGDKLDAASGIAYDRMLPDALLPAIAHSMEKQLAQAGTADSDALYETLRVYLMLFEPAHFDAKAVRAWVAADWDINLPKDLSEDSRHSLLAHLDALLENGAPHPPLRQDAALVATARAVLAKSTVAARIYGRLKRAGVAGDIPEFNVAQAGGPSAPLVFVRASGGPLNKGIPGLFTFDGFHQGFKTSVGKYARQLANEEPWVLGTAAKPQDPVRVAGDVRSLYLDEYIKRWDEYLGDVRLAQSGSLQKSIESTRLLAQPDSPLVRFLLAVARETTLVLPTDAKTSGGNEPVPKIALKSKTVGAEANAIGRKIDELSRTAQDVGAIAGASSSGIKSIGLPDDGAERAVDEHFAAVAALVSGKPAPIDQTRQLLAELNTHLIAVDSAAKTGATPPAGTEIQNKLKANAGGMPPLVKSMVESVTGSSESQAQVAAVNNLRKSYQSGIGELCTRAVQGRYPFARGSNRDVARDDFAQLFAPGGMFDDFFQKQLAATVDTTTKPWSFRTSDGAKGRGSLAVFQQAAAIRDAFFRGGTRTPSLRVDLKLIDAAEGITQVLMDMDGQQIKFDRANTLPVSAQWPGPNGGAGVRVQAALATGPVGSGIQAEGPWALLRLMDRARTEPAGGPEKFRAHFDLDGRTVTFEVTAGSVQNPFRLKEMAAFSCAGL